MNTTNFPTQEAPPTFSVILPDDTCAANGLAGQLMHHPLFTGEVLIPTPPINEMFLIAKLAILLRENGLVFTGPSGIGKTNALNIVRAMLQQQYPRLCIYTHNAHNHQIASIRGFFKHFLKTSGHIEQRGETFDLRDRLVKVLADDARISGTNMVVMLIDEANAMITSDFLFLKDVYNDLGLVQVQFITVLMGQSPDLECVINNLRLEGRDDLIARFATRILPLRGYGRVQDLQSIFKGIDCYQYPDRSGCSWTSFFLPRACQAGFRFENEAQGFRDAILAEAGIATPTIWDIPARQTFLAIRSFLLRASSYDSENLSLPPGCWRDAVLYAKVADAAARVQARDKQAKRRRRS